MTKKYWGYTKGKGRFYQRKSGTIRYPDLEEKNIYSGARKDSSEPTGQHQYGYDKGYKKKKPLSKTYKTHTFKSHGKPVKRGGYRRRLK